MEGRGSQGEPWVPLLRLFQEKNTYTHSITFLSIYRHQVQWSYSVGVNTPDFESGDLGSNPSKTFLLRQLSRLEHTAVNRGVAGSIPVRSVFFMTGCHKEKYDKNKTTTKIFVKCIWFLSFYSLYSHKHFSKYRTFLTHFLTCKYITYTLLCIAFFLRF